MDDMFSFFQDFENFDAQHYIETIKELLQTDVRFQNMTFGLLALFVILIIILIIGHFNTYK